MEKFLFGVATSATQIEGAYNQDGKGLSIWDEYSAKGLIQNGVTCFRACDSYNRMEEDLENLQKLGVNSYRFSIAWSRIQPKGYGEINPKGIAYYNRLIDGLLERGIKPMITLFHWDLPIGIQEKGGFANREIVQHFEEYAKIVAENFGDRVELFSVFNEAQALIDFLFLRPVGAAYPPFSVQKTFEGMHNLLLANAAATYALRKYSKKQVQVGMVNCTHCYIPTEEGMDDVIREEMFKPDDTLFCNTTFWDPVFFGKYDERLIAKQGIDLSFVQEGEMEYIKCVPDFLGLNIYIGHKVKWGEAGMMVPATPDINSNFGDMWGDYMNTADAMYYGPKYMQERYGKPVYITENGCTLSDFLIDGTVEDQVRGEYIRRYLTRLLQAREEGIDIRGYYAWTLMDNFEWSSGFTRRFGLIYVDFETCERTPKSSYYKYQELIRKYKDV